jgi:hypothetical protein
MCCPARPGHVARAQYWHAGHPELLRHLSPERDFPPRRLTLQSANSTQRRENPATACAHGAAGSPRSGTSTSDREKSSPPVYTLGVVSTRIPAWRAAAPPDGESSIGERLPGCDVQQRKAALVHIQGGLFLGGSIACNDREENLLPIGSDGKAQQRVDMDQRSRCGNCQPASGLARFTHPVQPTRTKAR